MNCPNCGAELLEEALFCSECGSKIELEKAEPESPRDEPVAEKTKSSRNGKILLGVMIFLLVAEIAGMLWYFLPDRQKEVASTTTTTESVSVTSTTTGEATAAMQEETTFYETTTEPQAQPQGAYYRVDVGYDNHLFFRAEPNEDATILDRLNNGERLYITDVRNNWGYTTFGGNSGWVCLSKNGNDYCVKE